MKRFQRNLSLRLLHATDACMNHLFPHHAKQNCTLKVVFGKTQLNDTLLFILLRTTLPNCHYFSSKSQAHWVEPRRYRWRRLWRDHVMPRVLDKLLSFRFLFSLLLLRLLDINSSAFSGTHCRIHLLRHAEYIIEIQTFCLQHRHLSGLRNACGFFSLWTELLGPLYSTCILAAISCVRALKSCLRDSAVRSEK